MFVYLKIIPCLDTSLCGHALTYCELVAFLCTGHEFWLNCTLTSKIYNFFLCHKRRYSNYAMQIHLLDFTLNNKKVIIRS